MSARSPLTAAQQELLARELARRRAVAVAAIQPRPAGQPPVLSLAQRRLWFLDRVRPGLSTYNATLTLRLHGRVDGEALRIALATVVRRHEVLRTVGIDVGGQPEARLLDDEPPWHTVQVGEEELGAALAAQARRPFDLAADVLVRGTLFALGPDRHVLLLVQHHIAADGFSRGPLFAELSELYNAAVEGRTTQLPPLAVQYADYALWQVQQLTPERRRASDEFWLRELAGANVVLDLPTDVRRTGATDHVGSRVAMDGPVGSADALRALARGERATYFMAAMAVSGVLLSAVCHADDVVLGSPMANRQQPELDGLIGFFVNTVILRVRLEGEPTFRELLARCRTAALGSLAHQDTPLEHVVELVNPRRIPGVNPLFQVNFRMQGAAPPPPQLTGLTVSRMITDTGSARFDLAIGVNDEPGAVRGYVEYDAGLFRPATAHALQVTFVDLVGWVCAEPDVPVSVLGARAREAFSAHRQAAATAARPSERSIRARS